MNKKNSFLIISSSFRLLYAYYTGILTYSMIDALFGLIVIASILWFQYAKIEVPPELADEHHVYKLNHVASKAVIWSATVAAKLKYGNAPSNIHHLTHMVDKMFLDKLTKDVHITDTEIDGVRVKIFKPVKSLEFKDLPILIYYHGGGFFMGSSDLYHEFITELTIQLNLVTICVNYKLAPEHPFPFPTQDCYKATKYVLESGFEFGDTSRVVLAGDSAGGNIVAVMTQRLLAEKINLPKLQVLIYPWTQMFNNRMPSHVNYKHRFEVGIAVAWYLGITDIKHSENLASLITGNNHTTLIRDTELKEKYISYTNASLIPKQYKMEKKYYDVFEKNFPLEMNPLLNNPSVSELLKNIFSAEFSPGLADHENLKGLPDAYFIIAEIDPIKDDGLIYSERLRNAGVKVDVKYYENAYHGIVQMINKNNGFQVARDMVADLVDYIRTNV